MFMFLSQIVTTHVVSDREKQHWGHCFWYFEIFIGKQKLFKVATLKKKLRREVEFLVAFHPYDTYNYWINYRKQLGMKANVCPRLDI